MKKILFVILLITCSNLATYHFAYNKGIEEGGSFSGIFNSSKKAISEISINPCDDSTSELCSSVNDSLERLSKLVEEK
jgi:hypothetical protein